MAKETVYELVPWNSHKPAFRLTEDEFVEYVLYEEDIRESKPTSHFDGFAASWGLFPVSDNRLIVARLVISGSENFGNSTYQFRARHPIFSGRWWRAKLAN